MSLNLYIHRVYATFLKKSKIRNNKKSRQTWLSKMYNNEPLISFIIQSHNKSIEVKHIVSKLRKVPDSEIIVIDDGSDLKHVNSISKHLKYANEFVIRSNDLYENVMYDRAIRFANGKYIALLQDDDDFENLIWVDKALNYFSQYPEMAILGGNEALNFDVVSENSAASMHYKEKIDCDFAFAHNVNRAPMWLNKRLLDEKLTHIDFSFAPFQDDDCELCLRAWINGLQVGWYNAGFKSLSAGGMRIWNSAFMIEQCIHNQKLLYDKYKDKKALIDKLVLKANNMD